MLAHITLTVALAATMPVAACNKDGCLIPGGTFAMGTDPSEFPRLAEETDVPDVSPFAPEQPRHRVTVQPFRLDATDVTNRDFLGFVAARSEWRRDRVPEGEHNGRYLEHWPAPDRIDPASANHPVVFVTWYAAVAYCEWRGGRLPTEAEWEFAAGAGIDERRFPWGDEPPDASRVNWYADGIAGTVPVASYPPNPFGLYDMAGNVWKFLADPWRDRYDSPPLSVLTVAEAYDRRERARRVVRGGSYAANAANLRVRYRDSHRPRDAREMVGFRCGKDAAAAMDAAGDL